VLSILYEIEHYNLAIDIEIIELLLRNAAVGIGVSGGKGSDAMALAIVPFLDEVEHANSLPQCGRLAKKVDMV
jgi:hypothetical protein